MSEGVNTPVSARRWPRILLLGSTMAAGIVIGAAGLAGAAMVGDHMGWRQHGPRLEHIQNFVRMSLDSVAATSDQEAKVHDIIASAFTDLTPKPEDRMAMRKQAIDILKAPTVDKAALEKLRTNFVADADARSKRFLDAVTQIADVLTPDQRAKLAERAEAWADRGPMMDGEHHRHGGRRDGWNGPGDDGPGGPQDQGGREDGQKPDNN
ncbi:Spy/CpxP family protein refolding chaperone [Labrys okinawensis]|uniref:Spy/CpxP family protein refolding chaperone n=1 Tax=Labrys okinawensis TaxID=346911 RepID=UPI0039BD2462